MKAKIDKRFVSALKPTGKAFDVTDTELPGFVLRVRESGAMFYAVRYRVNGGPPQRLTIGSATVISPQDARDKSRKHLADATRGTDPGAAKRQARTAVLTFEWFIDEEFYPNHLKRLRTGEAAKKRIKDAFKDFLDLPLDKIDEKRIAKWKAGAKVKPATINRYLDDLRSALSRAVAWGNLPAAPKVKRDKLDSRGRVRFLTREEEKKLLAALDTREEELRSGRDSGNVWNRDRGYPERPSLRGVVFADHLKPMVLIAMNTGIRRGELFNLRWSDIDFDQAILTVRGATAKSGQTRHIELNSVALAVLRDWRKQSPAHGYVFPSASGQRFDNVKTSWEGLVKDAGIENFRWHDLRHNFASRLVQAGIPLNTVRELLGHSDIKMTLRYSHLAPHVKARAVEALVVPEGKVLPFRKGKEKA
jgi:integrase